MGQIEKEQVYPQNLLMAILEKTQWGIPVITGDIQAGIEYAVSTLESREREVLFLHFKARKKYSQIGKEFGVSSSRIQQIMDSACKKLRSESRINYILHGIAGYLKKVYCEEYQKGYATEYLTSYRGGKTELKWYVEENTRLPLKALNLSMRTYNCLLRAGLRTVFEVATLNEDRIKDIRDLKKENAIEIAKALHRENILFTAWDDYCE